MITWIDIFSAVTCQTSLNPPKMSSSCDGDKVGSKCTYKCEKGYNLVGANERECKSDGKWSHALPHCQGKFLILLIRLEIKYLKNIFEKNQK